MYEHSKEPLLPLPKFYQRVVFNVLIALLIIGASLFIGMAGYHWIAGLSWMDSLLNASMILTGMGPVNEMPDNPSKLFASLYALYSGVAFLTTIAVLFAPVIHRFMHKHNLSVND